MTITSFGYDSPKGTPSRHDDHRKIFDVRELTHDTRSPEFVKREQEIVDFATEHPQMNIAIGCKKGKHRSVALAGHIAHRLRTSVMHRDL